MKTNYKEEVSEIREMMDTVGVLNFPNEDMINFVRLSQHETGLNIDIMVDNSKSYIQYKHPLWLYVRLGKNEFGIVTVEENPKILSGNFSNIDVDEIMRFIVMNRELLQSFADKEILGRDFFKNIAKVNITDRMVMEMANMQKEESGLPCEIW